MIRYIIILCFVICNVKLAGQSIVLKKIPTDSFFMIINQPKDSQIYIINFWATWCKPCIEELPYFTQLDSLYKDSFKFIFLSFDGASAYDKTLKFIQQKKLIGTHYLLTDGDMNGFINGINKNWEGNIPVTILLNRCERRDKYASFENITELKKFIHQ